MSRYGTILISASAVVPAVAFAGAATAPITLSVDLRDANKRIIHTTEVLDVRPGPLTLAYPKWIPNEHVLGPISQQVNMFIRPVTNNRTSDSGLSWSRDVFDPYLYRTTIPVGVTKIEVKFDFITSSSAGDGQGSSDAYLDALDWNTSVMYPYSGPQTKVADLIVSPTIILPAGWKLYTALAQTLTDRDGSIPGEVKFRNVSIQHLIDSPVLAGEFGRRIELAPKAQSEYYLDVVADDADELDVPPTWTDALTNSIHQTVLSFGRPHYKDYNFLVTLSDRIGGEAYDHLESMDDKRPLKFFSTSDKAALFQSYTVHDFIHSWNGKYRRPVGMATPNYQVSVDATGLWMYEGLTAYLTNVISTHAGIFTPQEFRKQLASSAAFYSIRPGVHWRDLWDTAASAYALWGNNDGNYDATRRDGYDVYGDGSLIWLGVDVMIRNLTHGSRSLDDFLAQFHGSNGGDTSRISPYTITQVVDALNRVAPNDWMRFLNDRVHTRDPATALRGLTDGGYTLVYIDAPDPNF